MSFIDNVKSTAEKAGAKLEELTDLAAANLRLFDAKNELDKLYCQLGKAAYNAFKSGRELRAEELAQKIDAKKEHIVKIEEKLAELKRHKICPSCGGKNGKEANFCSNCAQKL